MKIGLVWDSLNQLNLHIYKLSRIPLHIEQLFIYSEPKNRNRRQAGVGEKSGGFSCLDSGLVPPSLPYGARYRDGGSTVRGKTAHAAERRVHPTEAAGTSATGINTQELNSKKSVKK